LISYYQFKSTLEWYDVALNQWQNCICVNCRSIKFQYCLLPPTTLSTVILLNDGCLFAAGGANIHGNGMKSTYLFDVKTNEWRSLMDMHFKRLKPFIVQLGSYVYAVKILFTLNNIYLSVHLL